jgi:hypothetical protein
VGGQYRGLKSLFSLGAHVSSFQEHMSYFVFITFKGLKNVGAVCGGGGIRAKMRLRYTTSTRVNVLLVLTVYFI